MTGFFTAEATEDCISMVIGIINLTETYCTSTDQKNATTYFLPRRISQDLVENGFSRIRLAVGHGRLDHRSTIAAATKVNTMKEVKSNDRSRKKRNADGLHKNMSTEPEHKPEESCIEYAKKQNKRIMEEKNLLFNVNLPFTWTSVDGKDFMHFHDV